MERLDWLAHTVAGNFETHMSQPGFTLKIDSACFLTERADRRAGPTELVPLAARDLSVP